MEDFLLYWRNFPAFFLAILLGYYLLPAGLAYLLFFVFKKEDWEKMRIQERRPKLRSIYHEIRWSLLSVCLFSIFTLILFYNVKKGYTLVYYDIGDYGWAYFLLSPLICMVLHDTYFYWGHRFMHLRAVFPWVHSVHHRSNPPTPWAILSFGPLECVILYAVYFLLAFFLPLHPVAAGIFIGYNIILNTGGHIGYEIVPRPFFNHWLLKYGLTVTHHEMHHAKGNCNYGLYFNFWDRVMKTNHREYERTFMRVRNKIEQQ
ncbi:MAG: sterol desaturase family protein [Lewinellaceae bacterium]|nr:sterol desaturase family protein [Phaeodactylibacter sp.]MCB9035216.1 sterol desaturase family protein [Lewinellaceae bacterium]